MKVYLDDGAYMPQRAYPKDAGFDIRSREEKVVPASEMDKATQQTKIINYCAEHGSITIREAFTKLNINSPSKRISEIRNSGLYYVSDTEENGTDKHGNKTRWKRYFIKERPPKEPFCDFLGKACDMP